MYIYVDVACDTQCLSFRHILRPRESIISLVSIRYYKLQWRPLVYWHRYGTAHALRAPADSVRCRSVGFVSPPAGSQAERTCLCQWRPSIRANHFAVPGLDRAPLIRSQCFYCLSMTPRGLLLQSSRACNRNGQ